jgi:hypothetical protein
MFELLVDTIRKADAAIVGHVLSSTLLPLGEDEGVVRVSLKVEEVLKGTLQSDVYIEVDIPAAGRETPETTVGKSYFVFLDASNVPAKVSSGEAAPWSPAPLSSPIAVPEADDRAAFVTGMQALATLAAGTQSDAEVKSYVLGKLSTRIPLLRGDASALAMGVEGWSKAELDTIEAFLAQADSVALADTERTNWVMLIARDAAPADVVGMARRELAVGDSDGIFFGLAERKDAAVQDVMTELLRTPDLTVRNRSLRLTGLLRRNDLLDWFEQALRDNPNASLNDYRQALDEARKLVDRDY